MFELASHRYFLLGVFITVTLGLLYLAMRFVQNDPPRTTPADPAFDEQFTFETPDGWDEETPLAWCNSCGTFNNAEYQYCLECSGHLTASQVLHPSTIVELQAQAEKRQNP